MSDYLKLTFLEEESHEIDKVNHHQFRNKPFSNSNVFLAPIDNFKLLTKGEDVKRVYDLKLLTKEISYDFLPGDTIGILPRNDDLEVNKLLIRLNIESYAEKLYKLEVSKETSKKNPTLPKHIPCSGILRDIFVYYIDIRKPPKKLFLKALIPFTTDPEEVATLQELCSPKGSKQYSDLIIGRAQTLLGLLDTFPSCLPPLEIIFEHSLPLQPRYFSISSSPLETTALHITFFVVENDDGTKGVCTGWLEELIEKNEAAEVPIYFRKPNNFRIPQDATVPIIMIATGTGLAPFKGFLDHRLLKKVNETCELGDALLIYGCRYTDRDFLYSGEIEEYLKEGILSKVYTAFSREGDTKCYVQDKIKENGEELVDYILRKSAVVYICGNVKSMLVGVKQAIVESFVKYGSLDKVSADDYLNKLIKENRILIDSW